MKIYGNPVSTCTRRLVATLAEKGQTVELVALDFAKGEHKSPEHIARQPFGQVPALEDGDFMLYESRAIMRYFDEVLPGPKLTPGTPKGRARMEQWISVESEQFSPSAMKIIHQAVFARRYGRDPDVAKIEEGKAGLVRPLQVLDRALGESAFLAADQITLADITYLPYLEFLDVGGQSDILADYPNVSRWWTSSRARPSWQKTLGK